MFVGYSIRARTLYLNIPIDWRFSRDRLKIRVSLSNKKTSNIYLEEFVSSGSAQITYYEKQLFKRFLLEKPFPHYDDYGWRYYDDTLFCVRRVDAYVLVDQTDYYRYMRNIPLFLKVDNNKDVYFPSVQLVPLRSKIGKDIDVTYGIDSIPIAIRIKPTSLREIERIRYLDHSEQNYNYLDEVILSIESMNILLAAALYSFIFLSLKNEMSFWKSIYYNLEGISVRSVICNELATILFLVLNLYDSPSLSIFIIFVFFTIVSCWRLSKVLDFKKRKQNEENTVKMEICDEKESHFLGFKIKESYRRFPTNDYDKKAFVKLKRFLILHIIVYYCYTLGWKKQRGWIDWITTSLISFIHVVHPLLSIPQIYINYKFKTVAYLPWRALTYRTLYRFIIFVYFAVNSYSIGALFDLFNNITVFTIYLYQRSKYSKIEVKIEEEENEEEDDDDDGGD